MIRVAAFGGLCLVHPSPSTGKGMQGFMERVGIIMVPDWVRFVLGAVLGWGSGKGKMILATCHARFQALLMSSEWHQVFPYIVEPSEYYRSDRPDVGNSRMSQRAWPSILEEKCFREQVGRKGYPEGPCTQ